ncbi:MAG: tRNA adenosine(34) deaminase TadA [Synergistaceae bacterium]
MDDLFFMKEALLEARRAMKLGEIPIGAVVVKDGIIVGRGYNQRKINNSPLDHAEIIAMKEAASNINSWRLDECTMYVTLEPCVMCAGASVQCRLGKIVYGARDAKAGGVGSLYDIPSDSRMYHRCCVVKGVLERECAELLAEFFRKKR